MPRGKKGRNKRPHGKIVRDEYDQIIPAEKDSHETWNNSVILNLFQNLLLREYIPISPVWLFISNHPQSLQEYKWEHVKNDDLKHGNIEGKKYGKEKDNKKWGVIGWCEEPFYQKGKYSQNQQVKGIEKWYWIVWFHNKKNQYCCDKQKHFFFIKVKSTDIKHKSDTYL